MRDKLDGADDEEFAEFFRTSVRRVEALALRITASPWDAEDVAIEAFARAYARWDRLSGADWRTGWVLKVAGNLAVDVVRRRRPVHPGAELLIADRDDETLNRLTLTVALRTLPRREKEVVVLVGLCGCSHEQAAGALGISTGSTKTYLHRAMKHLRSRMGADRPGGELAHVVE